MIVEWDEAKRRQNLDKHGVDFIDAAKIFKAPFLDRVDDREDYGEKRRIALGRTGSGYFVVVYTWRDDARRLISAWKAGRNDRKSYDEVFDR